MKNNKLVKLYRNIFEQGTAKGSFFITDSGLMTPRTRNVTLWGLTSASSIPPKYRGNPKIVTAERGAPSPFTPVQLPAFFKFQKSPISGFTEAVSMEIASHFDTKTCYNFPAHIDQSSVSLYNFASPDIPVPQSDFGSLVYSFLGRDEELFSFYKIAKNGDISYDFMTMSSLVPSFINDSLPHISDDKKSETITQIQQDFAYQYLLRDYLGDIDYTSKNTGIVINKTLGYANLAPNFDYGETLNLLITSKFNYPQLQTLEDFPEVSRPFIKQEIIDKANAKKLEDYNAPASEIAKKETFPDKSEINIRFICSKFPEVAEAFRQDLQGFVSSGQLPKIVGQYATQDALVTAEQAQMCVEYLEERGAIFENRLTEQLEKVVPDYASFREQRLYTSSVTQEEQIARDDLSVAMEGEEQIEEGAIFGEEAIVDEYQITQEGIRPFLDNSKINTSTQNNYATENSSKFQDESLEFPQ